MADAAARGDIIQSIERCFAVLEAFERVAGRATTSSLAAETSLPRPVVRRILLTLTSLGYARPAGSAWQLEPTILRFSSLYADTSAFISVSRAHAEKLSQLLGETTALCERDGAVARIVFAVHAEHFLALRADIGQPLPLHATAPGHVILAWTEVPETLPMPRYTDSTITDPDRLSAALDLARTRGFAQCEQLLEVGLIDVAVPVFDPHGEFLGTISTAMSAGRRDAELIATQVVPALKDSAAAITQDLGLLDAWP